MKLFFLKSSCAVRRRCEFPEAPARRVHFDITLTYRSYQMVSWQLHSCKPIPCAFTPSQMYTSSPVSLDSVSAKLKCNELINIYRIQSRVGLMGQNQPGINCVPTTKTLRQYALCPVLVGLWTLVHT